MSQVDYYAECQRQELDIPLAGSDDADAVGTQPMEAAEYDALMAEFPPARPATEAECQAWADALNEMLRQSLPHYMPEGGVDDSEGDD